MIRLARSLSMASTEPGDSCRLASSLMEPLTMVGCRYADSSLATRVSWWRKSSAWLSASSTFSASRWRSSLSTRGSLACVSQQRRSCAASTFPKWGAWATIQTPSSTSRLSLWQRPFQEVAANKFPCVSLTVERSVFRKRTALPKDTLYFYRKDPFPPGCKAGEEWCSCEHVLVLL